MKAINVQGNNGRAQEVVYKELVLSLISKQPALEDLDAQPADC
jgi:hypothetical protein